MCNYMRAICVVRSLSLSLPLCACVCVFLLVCSHKQLHFLCFAQWEDYFPSYFGVYVKHAYTAMDMFSKLYMQIVSVCMYFSTICAMCSPLRWVCSNYFQHLWHIFFVQMFSVVVYCCSTCVPNFSIPNRRTLGIKIYQSSYNEDYVSIFCMAHSKQILAIRILHRRSSDKIETKRVQF